MVLKEVGGLEKGYLVDDIDRNQIIDGLGKSHSKKSFGR